MRLSTTLLLAGALSLGLMGLGVAMWVHQHQQLTDADPATGQVLESRHRGRSAWISYEYRVEGEVHQSDQLTPLPMWLNPQEVMSRFPEGAAMKVYVDPTDPAQAYLIRRAAAYPHLLIFAGASAVLLTWRLLRRTGAMEPSPYPTRTLRSGWYVLPRTTTPMEAIGARFFEGMLWLLLVAGCVWHYHAASPAGGDWMILLTGAGLLGVVIPAVEAWRWLGVASSLGEPRLSVMQDHLELDQPMIARLTLPVWRELDVREVRISLVCEQRYGLSRHNLLTTSAIAAAYETLHPQQPFEGEYVFDVPKKKRRSSCKFQRFAASRLDWRLELHVEPIHGRRYVIHFPVRAQTKIKQKQSAAA